MLLTHCAGPESAIMWKLHLPRTVWKAQPAGGAVSILVGQRSCIAASPGAALQTVCVLAGLVPCGDCSVAEEQVECLERVLPFGIDVLGFAGDRKSLASLAAAAPELKARSLLQLVHSEASTANLLCHVLGTPATKVDVVESEAVFVIARCALHTFDSTAPLLVTCPSEAAAAAVRVVDGESCAPLAPQLLTSSSEVEVIQTGAASSAVRLHAVVVPSLTSARSLCETLFRQLKSCAAAGITRLVELNARNTHLLYCCRLEGRTGAPTSADTVTEDDWTEVREMVEDATGQVVARSDVRHPELAARAAATAGAAVRTKPSATTKPRAAQVPLPVPLYALVGLVVVLVAGAVLFLR